MTYTIEYICSKEEFNLKHQTNSYDQAEHFYWAMVMKLKSAHDNIDTNTWTLSLSHNVTVEDHNRQPKQELEVKYLFSKH